MQPETEPTTDTFRRLVEIIVEIADRDKGKMLLPKPVSEMTKEEYAMFDLVTRFAGRLLYIEKALHAASILR